MLHKHAEVATKNQALLWRRGSLPEPESLNKWSESFERVAVNRVALHGPRPGSQVEIDPVIEI
jgi:hypothetical protein